jgi:hypothetical protein
VGTVQLVDVVPTVSQRISFRAPARARRSIAGLLCVALLGGLTVTVGAEPASAEDKSSKPFRISWAPNRGDTNGSSTQGSASADGQWAVFLSTIPEYGSSDGDLDRAAV